MKPGIILSSFLTLFLLLALGKLRSQTSMVVEPGKRTYKIAMPNSFSEYAHPFMFSFKIWTGEEVLLPCNPYSDVVNIRGFEEQVVKLSVDPDPKLPAKFKDQSLTLTYYSGEEPALYESIRKNAGAISYAYIKKLSLDKLVDSSGKSKIIKSNLIFDHCIIESFIEPKGFGPNDHTQKSKYDSIVFNGKFFFNHCVLDYFTLYQSVFKKDVIISNTYAIDAVGGTNFNFKNCHFNNKCLVYIDDLLSGLNAYNTSPNVDSAQKWVPWIYRKVYHFDDSVYNSYVFNNCSFNDTLNIYAPNKFVTVDVANCVFQKRVFLGLNFLIHDASTRPVFYKETTAYPFINMYNVNLNRSRFLKGIDFENFTCVDFNCSSSYFSDTIFIMNAAYKKKNLATANGLFSKTYFDNNACLVLSEDNIYTLDSLQINPVSFERMTIVSDTLISGHPLSKQELEEQQLFYNTIGKWATSRYSGDITDKIKAKMDHQSLMVTNNYNRQHFWNSPRAAFSYLGISLLEILVGNGYNGEMPFLVSVLTILLVFTLLYFFGFRNEVVNYALVQYENSPKAIQTRISLVNFIRCFWISFIIFITPKYPIAFFKQKTLILILFSAEWIIGLAMIIMFLIYIASKYNFIKALIGI